MTHAYPHEAWCPHCHVSHVPGTKRCLHCGGRVLPVRPGEGVRLAAAAGAPAAFEGGAAPELAAEPADEEQAAAARAARPLRIGVATIWIVLAVVGAILRTCAERG